MDLPNIVLPDATKALLAAGISLAANGPEGDITAAIAGTMATSELTLANQALAGQVGKVNALDIRRAVVLGGVAKVLPMSAVAITTQYLLAQPITIEGNAPVFATTVVKALPIVVNNINRDDFAGTTGVVASKFTAGAIDDTHFKTKAGIARAVVVAVPTFAEETVRVVAAQVQSNLNAISDQGSVAVAFANDVVADVRTSTMPDTTNAMVAHGTALAFVGQEGKVAQAVADAPLAGTSATPTDASRAAIAAAVAKAVPTATQDIAARVAASLGTIAANKIAFGAALIPLLPATSGVTNAAKAIAAGLADPNFSTFADDNARIAFAVAFATHSTATKAVAVSSLIAGGVASQLADIPNDAPSLAAGVASGVAVAASTPAIAAEVARVAPATSAGNIAFAVANLSSPAFTLTDANRTSIATSVLGVVATGSQAASAPDIANQIAGIEADASKAALATALGKMVYSDATAVGAVAKKISDHVLASPAVGATGVSPADTIRQGIASAALKSGLPVTFVLANAPALAPGITAAADAIAKSGIVGQFNSALSMANLANTLVMAVTSYATTVTGPSTVAGDIAISVAQQLSDPADKAAAAAAATRASLTQAATIAVAVANYGAGTDTVSLHTVNDAAKALIAQKVVLAATTQAVSVTNSIVALVDGDGTPADINQSKANVAKAVVTSVPTQAVVIAQNVAAPNDATLRVLVAQGIAQGLPVAYATSAGPVAFAIAQLVGNSITTKASIAATVVTVLPLQAVDVADKVAAPNVAADKAIIAAAVAVVIPGAQQTSTTERAAAGAANVAGQIAPASGGAAGDLAPIAAAVAGAGGNVSLTIAPDIAKAVATKFATTLAAAAPTISSEVAGVSGMTIANQAAVAKAVAAAVTAQASAVATTTLSTSLTQKAGTTAGTTPDAIAGVFAVAIPAQAAPIAGTATTYYAITYLPAHVGTTIRAGDIAVSVSTSTGVLTTAIPGIATQVAQAIFPTNHAAIGGIADKFADAVTTSPGNLSQTNFNAQAPGIATSLGTVAAPTGRESSELAGIVAALTEALPIATAANMTLIATITKNVALVATNYWTTQGATYNPTDLVGFLVAEILARSPSSNSVAAGSVLAALRTALTSSGSTISIATVNAVYGNNGTTGVVSINPAYANMIAGAGLGTIGDVLSNATPVTNF